MSTPDSYLGINDYKIGAPPNWQNPKYWKSGFFKQKFSHAKYVQDVESYMVKAHERHWEDIERIDKLNQERGEGAELMEEQLAPVMETVERWADKWRLCAEKYDEKWGA